MSPDCVSDQATVCRHEVRVTNVRVCRAPNTRSVPFDRSGGRPDREDRVSLEQHPLFLDALSAFAQTLVRRYDVDAVLKDLLERVVKVLDLSGGGVTLWEDGDPRFVSAVSTGAAELEEVQSVTGQGACVLAYRTGQVVAVTDLGAEVARWPDYCAKAAEHGVEAVVGVPLVLDEQPIGALNLYSPRVHEWAADELQLAELLAHMATSYVVNANTLDQQRQLNGQLQGALESRVVIEQAKGVVASARGVTVEEAFDLIRKHARDHNTKLRTVAEAVVHAGLRI